MIRDYFGDNRPLLWDYRLGLRGLGLIVYGALPSSLGALGAFKPPEQANLFSSGADGFWFLICIAAIPTILTFLLVRQRLSNWYLFRDYLIARTLVVTIGILAVSTLVCFSTGVVLGTYKLVGWQAWSNLTVAEKTKPLVQSLLFAIAYLVGSATLFLTVLKEDGSLPLLPKKLEIDKIVELRQKLNRVLNMSFWTDEPTDKNLLAKQIEALRVSARESAVILAELKLLSPGIGRAKLYGVLEDRLDALSSAGADLLESNLFWPKYWGATSSQLNEVERTRRNKILQLKAMRL